MALLRASIRILMKAGLGDRVAGVLRSFDITVKLSTEIEHTFTSVNKDEYKNVKGYLESKKVRVKEIGEENTMRALDDMDLGSEDDDEDSEEDRRAAKKSQGGKDRRAGPDDDDESGESMLR
jgi:structure-specific recognition protein 1